MKWNEWSEMATTTTIKAKDEEIQTLPSIKTNEIHETLCYVMLCYTPC